MIGLYALFLALGLALLALSFALTPTNPRLVAVICSVVLFAIAAILAVIPGVTT